MVDATEVLGEADVVALFNKYGVLTPTELKAREEVKYENYSKVINIEALTMIDMATKQIIPAVIKYTKSLADTVLAVKAAGCDADVQAGILAQVSDLLKEAKAALSELEKVAAEAAQQEEGKVQARFFNEVVFKAMDALRAPVDKLEMIVDKEAWPMPSYGDLLFEV